MSLSSTLVLAMDSAHNSHSAHPGSPALSSQVPFQCSLSIVLAVPNSSLEE